MNGFGTGNDARRCGASRAPDDDAADSRHAPDASGANGMRRVEVNWAWATSNAHYDWMDHAPLFDCRD